MGGECHRTDLVDALGEDHGAEQLLELGDGVDADGAAELAELAPPPLELLPEHALPLAPAVPGPRPGGPRRGPGPPRRLRQPRRLVPHPRLHAARQRGRHWRGPTCGGAICRGARRRKGKSAGLVYAAVYLQSAATPLSWLFLNSDFFFERISEF